jgi:hypothetical protein
LTNIKIQGKFNEEENDPTPRELRRDHATELSAYRLTERFPAEIGTN